ncbi:uncharacterized protein LOC142524290 [Primulina tabacum]|uniref:uncharacterized protein LOC142524290 n=1 Tax=Primulina tabacum TaxID=48773 RepID=UPI003F5A80B9
MMEQSSDTDLDLLLQSHDDDEEDDSAATEADRHLVTVDEILLNHSSPSPPASPRNDDYFPRRQEQSQHRDSNVSTFNYSASGASGDTYTTKYMGRVLPHLFGGGLIKSNSKPGAALEAAAAASRSFPTPHAVAIKSMRATTGAMRSVVSDTSAMAAVGDELLLSQSSVASGGTQNWSDAGNDLEGLGFSESQEAEDVGLEELRSSELDSISVKADAGGGHSSGQGVNEAELLTNLKTLAEVGDMDEVHRIANEEEACATLKFETLNAPPVENEKESVLDEECEVTAEVFPSDITGEDDVTAQHLSIFVDLNMPYGDEYKTRGVKSSDFSEVVSEHGDRDYASSPSDVSDLLSPQDVERNGGELLKNSHSSIKPLDLAEEIEKKQAYTGLHYEEGVAAQPMRLEGVTKGSVVLGYFDVNADNAVSRMISSPYFRRDHGSPQVVAVHVNYIAVGMSKGTIFVVPSKYNAHHVDNMNEKMTLLGLQDDRSLVSVTAMCFNQNGDLLFAGYGDGHYTIWDVQKASALKVVMEHRAPVVHLLYLGPDSQVTRQFHVVSGDSKGVVKLIRFSVVPWVNVISYTKSVKLFDETTSKVLCASPLLYGEGHGGAMASSQGSSSASTNSGGSTAGGIDDEGVVMFVTHQSALVAKVSPSVKVYAQIPKPDGVKEGAMPYAALKCMSQSPGSSSENTHVEALDKALLLAIAWDQKIQVAKLVKSELKTVKKWDLESPAIGLAWLDDQMLVVLTFAAQIYLFASDGNEIHHTSFYVDGFQWDDLISYHIYFTNAFGNPEKAYHNSVAIRGATLYILGPEHLVVSRLLSWKERIEVLQKSGDWMGALNMAMTFYDGQTHGAIDLPKNLNDIQICIMPFLVELIQSYVNGVFSYLLVICGNQDVLMDPDEIKEQYTRVGGVAVEFCVHIRRTDILFDDILSKFEEANAKEIFLELLEPYILKDMLGSLPPAIMQALVEHYCERGWLQRIEQCVLHMDMLSLDFNQVVRLCREHRLHHALIYLFNKGLDDFTTPLEEFLIVLQNSRLEDAASLGYMMLVYLKYCFRGLAFPPGRGSLPLTRLPSLREELLQSLLMTSSVPNTWAVTILPANGVYANILHLLQLDTEATLDVLNYAFTEDELPLSTDSSQESTYLCKEPGQSQILVQKTVDILAGILDASNSQRGSPLCCDDMHSKQIWPSKKDLGHMCDYIAYHVMSARAKVSRDILGLILEYLTSDVDISYTALGKTAEILKINEKQLLSLLEVLPEAHWDPSGLLHLCEKAQFHQVCGYIHSTRHQYVAALHSYMKIANEPIHAFSFIHYMLQLLCTEEYDTFESAVISSIPVLIKLSREGAHFLITDQLSGKSQQILSDLHSQQESLFLYLKTVIEIQTTGSLDLSCLKKADVSDIPNARRAHKKSIDVEAYLVAMSNSLNHLRNNEVHVTDEMTELYFELLCQYERESVLKFLETSESYRVENCLRLCQEYGIVDAASFLLERVGEVGSALLLILSNLRDRIVKLDAVIQKGCFDSKLDDLNPIMKKKDVADIFDLVRSCIGLCQRNSPRLEPDESEHLWFQLLDSFFDFLSDSSNVRINSGREVLKYSLDGSYSQVEDEDEWKAKRKISRPRKSHIKRKLFTIFIKEIVEGMIGYVKLPRIMLKLLSDNGNQEFGDFKLTILGMLGTYDFERRILDIANSLIQDDTYYTMSLLRKGASHGYAPRNFVCCICNSLLAKNSDSNVQVFSCGHAMHAHCEPEENEESFRGTSAGCPICSSRKKSTRGEIGKSVFDDNGLVSKFSLRAQQASGTQTLHPHDQHDIFENSFFSHTASRFELLNNLQKDQKLVQLENTVQLRLAPPAIYHEKLKKKTEISGRESTSRVSTTEKSTRQSRDKKLKGLSLRSTLKTNIFRNGNIREK